MLRGLPFSRTIRRCAATVLTVSAMIPALAGASPISVLHQNDANGNVLNKGTSITVTGVVTVPDSTFSTTATDNHIQDATGGVDVFQSGGLATYHMSLGDSVTITGTIAQFNGLTEISPITSFTKHASGRPQPDPVILTCDSVMVGSMWANYTDPHEAQLIRVNNVHIVSGTWPTTVSGTNVSVYVQDAVSANSMQVFIDKDTKVNGTPAPGDTFSIVGVLRQFDSLVPFNFGYELVPRFAWDVIRRGPAIVTGPSTSPLDSISATIVWTTDKNADSKVEYGTTAAYGTTLYSPTLTTVHSVPITGLTPNTFYHYRVTTADSLGVSTQTADITFLTPSNRPGIINVYFNHSVDTTYALNGVKANSNADLGALMINRINSATYSLDVMLYSFSYPAVTNALISAWNRGVKVRFIMDAGNSGTEMNRLTAAGIPCITSTYGGNHSRGIMHNKVIVVDGRDGNNTNDWVWTGSANCTSSGLYTDAQNSIEIQDYGLSQCYTSEFNEMWGSTTDTPNSATAKMGSAKSNNTPHTFTVNGIAIEQYMSPSDGTESQIVSEINALQKSALFCILTYTQDGYTGAFQAKPYASTFKLRGLFDSGIDASSEWYDLTGTGGNQPFSPPADVHLDGLSSGLLHHKYLVGDVDNAATSVVVTGSHNWSNAANSDNDENTLILHDEALAALYLQEFAARYHEAGGVNALPYPEVVPVGVRPGDGGTMRDAALTVLSPTPSRDGVTLAYRVDATHAAPAIAVFDMAGRQVRALRAAAAQAPGTYQIRWDGRGHDGTAVSAGVYVVRMTAGGTHTTRRVVIAE